MATELGSIDLNIVTEPSQADVAAAGRVSTSRQVVAAGQQQGRGGGEVSSAGGGGVRGALGRLGPAGIAIGAALGAVALGINRLNNTLKETTDRFSKLNAAVAIAQAEEMVSQIQRDIRSAAVIGDAVADATRAVTRFRDEISVTTSALTGAFAVAKSFLFDNVLTPIARFVNTFMTTALGMLSSVMSFVFRMLADIEAWLQRFLPFSSGFSLEERFRELSRGLALLPVVIEDISETLRKGQDDESVSGLNNEFLKSLEALAGQPMRVR